MISVVNGGQKNIIASNSLKDKISQMKDKYTLVGNIICSQREKT